MAPAATYSNTYYAPTCEKAEELTAWQSSIATSISTLTQMAGTTEDEFLQIGSRLQEFYFRTAEISSLATRLVEIVSGEQSHTLIERLRRIMADMNSYLSSAQKQNRKSSEILGRIFSLLDQVSQPLEGFQKMHKMDGAGSKGLESQ